MGRRLNAHDFCAFSNLGILIDGYLRNDAIKGRHKRVFHLHGLDNGNALAADDPRALLHQHVEHLAMHRRPHKPTSVLIPSVVQSEVTQSNLGLTPTAQDIDRLVIAYDQPILRGYGAIDGDALTAWAIPDLRNHPVAFYKNWQLQPSFA